jgi:F-type H+-transporting ATPase subunit beta
MLETGIKVLDVLAPLPRGGTIRTTAQGGVGKMVLLAEIVHRLARRGGRAVYVRWHERFYRPEDADAEQRELGIDHVASLVLGRMRASARGREAALLEGLQLAESLRDEPAGGRDVLLLVDAPPTGELPLAAVRPRIGVRSGGGSITLLAFDLLLPNTEYARGPIEADAWDTRLVFDRGQAKRGIYPALDALESSSALLCDGRVREAHARVADDVRGALRGSSNSEVIDRLQHYQSQPFFVAEPWTARPGEFVPLADSLAGYRAILSA